MSRMIPVAAICELTGFEPADLARRMAERNILLHDGGLSLDEILRQLIGMEPQDLALRARVWQSLAAVALSRK